MRRLQMEAKVCLHRIAHQSLHRIAHAMNFGDDLLPQELLSDIDIFKEESDEDYEISSDDGQESNDESSENKDQEEITAGNATYYAQFFQSRLRRNILTQSARIDASPDCEINAFKLFYRPEIIFLIVRETNRKARDVRHQYGLLPNSVYKDFTIEEVETGIAIMIRAGLDRDNFTDLRRFWDFIDSRHFIE